MQIATIWMATHWGCWKDKYTIIHCGLGKDDLLNEDFNHILSSNHKSVGFLYLFWLKLLLSIRWGQKEFLNARSSFTCNVEVSRRRIHEVASRGGEWQRTHRCQSNNQSARKASTDFKVISVTLWVDKDYCLCNMAMVYHLRSSQRAPRLVVIDVHQVAIGTL